MAWDAFDGQAARAAEALTQRLRSWQLPARHIYREDGFLLACLAQSFAPATILPLNSERDSAGGAIYGTVFRKSQSACGERQVTGLDRVTASRVSSTHGRDLYAAYWGSYIAFIRTQCRLLVQADPAASMPCHFAQQDGVTLFFSHLEACPFIDRSRFTVNEGFISRLLVYDKIQTGETGLSQVRELGAGEQLCLDRRGLRVSLAWDPRVIARNVSGLSPADAADELRAICDHVVRSWASCFRQVSVSLSGGLDSAIVLSCLTDAGAGPELSAFHNLLDSDDFPELSYAQEAARRAGIALRVIRSSPSGALPDIHTHPPTARPLRGFLAPHLDSPFDEESGPQYSRAVFTGQGGDHVFHARQSPLTFADLVFNTGLTARMAGELMNASRLSGYSIWKVMHSAMNYRRVAAEAGLTAAVRARQERIAGLGAAALPMGHCFPGWTESMPGVAPLKSVQIAGLAHLYEGQRHGGQISGWHAVDPLVSQPLIELCLRLPTYTLCDQGVARGLARLAFRGRIPDSIRIRTSKGSATGFFAEQIGRDHARIFAALAGGELVRRGLLSKADIALLDRPESPHVKTLGRTLLSWYSIEAWLRSWRHQRAD